MNGAVADWYGGPFLMLICSGRKIGRGRQSDATFRDNGFEALDGIFVGSTANIAGSIIVIIGEQAADLPVVLNASGPVALIAIELMFLLAWSSACCSRRREMSS